jgi:hypothetical protein
VTFFSAGLYNGNMGGHQGANTICSTAYTAGGVFSGTWNPQCSSVVALLSSEISNMKDLAPDDSWTLVPVYGPSGIRIVDEWYYTWYSSTVVTGTLRSLADAGLPSAQPWWTGTTNGTVAGLPCANSSGSDWSTSIFSVSGKLGDPVNTDRNAWTSSQGDSCLHSNYLFCACFGSVPVTASPTN